MKKLFYFLIMFCFIATNAFGVEIQRQKNAATIVAFPITDNDGDPTTGCTCDAEYTYWTDDSSPGSFNNLTTNTCSVIQSGGSDTGWYYLTLTQSEMNHDYIGIQVKVTVCSAKTQNILIRTMVGDPLNISTTNNGGAINVTSGKIDEVTTLTGNTPQTGDAYAIVNHGTYGNSALNANINVVKDVIKIRNVAINDASPTTLHFISTLTESTNDYWNNEALLFTSGANAGLIRGIKDYNGTTKEVTLNTALPVAPSNGDTFSIIMARAFKLSGTSADELWAATTRQLTGTQSFNLTGNITGNLSGSVGSVTNTVTANVTQWAGSNVATPNASGYPLIDVGKWLGTTVNADTAGYPKVTVKSGTGTGEIQTSSGAITTCNSLGSSAVSSIWTATYGAELSDCTFTAYPAYGKIMQLIFQGVFFKQDFTSATNTGTLYKSDSSTSLCTYTGTDNGTLFIKTKMQ